MGELGARELCLALQERLRSYSGSEKAVGW